jgi:hypothetical protein
MAGGAREKCYRSDYQAGGNETAFQSYLTCP